MNIKNSNGVVAIAVFYLYIITAFFFSFAHINVFLEKSLKVSLFVAKTDVYD